MTMNLKQYRLMDLGLLSLMAVAAQFVGAFLHSALPGAGFYINFAVLVALIAVFRWGVAGTVVLMISGIPMVFMGVNGPAADFLIHVAAPGTLVLAAWLLGKAGQEQVRNDLLKLFLLTVVTYILLAVGQGLAAALLGENLLAAAAFSFIADGFNLVITYIVLLIVRKRQGLMVDMRTYFEREQNNHEYSS